MNKMKEKVELSNEDGFSLLELVIAIGIILVLTVGGLIGYSAISENSKKAAVESAASDVMTAAMVRNANGDNIMDEEYNPSTEWNESAKDDSIITEMFITDDANGSDGDSILTVKATYRGGDGNADSPVAERSSIIRVNSGGSSEGVVENIDAPVLTAECKFNEGVLGLGSDVEFYWEKPEGYSLDNIVVETSTSGLGSERAVLDGFNLSANTTLGSNGTYTTEIPTNMLGGSLGLGSEIEIAIYVQDNNGNKSDSVSIATNAGLIAGLGGTCRNM